MRRLVSFVALAVMALTASDADAGVARAAAVAAAEVAESHVLVGATAEGLERGAFENPTVFLAVARYGPSVAGFGGGDLRLGGAGLLFNDIGLDVGDVRTGVVVPLFSYTRGQFGVSTGPLKELRGTAGQNYGWYGAASIRFKLP